MFDFKFHLKKLLLTIFTNNFINTLFGIFPIKLGKRAFSHWDWSRFSAPKRQSEHHCKYYKSVLRTLTKFVIFSNQKVRKIFSSFKLLGKSVHSYKSRSKAIVYDFVKKCINFQAWCLKINLTSGNSFSKQESFFTETKWQ